MKAPERVGQDRMRERRQGDHRQLAAPEGAQAGSGGRHALQPCVGLPDLVVECQRRHGGPQTPVHALEQRKTDAALHARQFAADRGLRRTKQLGRPRDAAGDHHRPEHFDMPMGQHGPPHIKNEWIFEI
ncbi:hypothetical protein G6F57_021642 [Rhizopus arrhizus]|nr:hypothetical protein G6F65_022060 [Rhizopus arrhizus]KAG1264165.1 hypothetical protein G6F66_014218 [Rhizopus arrhizus]KAG1434312.1 hypothetical protein G6F57_021642 [Rhizopus arrhizus]